MSTGIFSEGIDIYHIVTTVSIFIPELLEVQMLKCVINMQMCELKVVYY